MNVARALILGIVLGAGVVGAGCGSSVGVTGREVGGTCSPAEPCDTGSICLLEGDFPGGMCSIYCAAGDQACPAGSVCVNKSGGLCLPACASPADCRGGYTCKGKKRMFAGGEALVCIKD
ncbi:MAG: hypothetical protein IT371_04460 [Deltaproteobacteria bacterium]|nr:hypothetical protein [Deltaproteobacteria bacterium]